MRCHICDAVLDKIIPNAHYRGGITPCSKCHEVSKDAMLYAPYLNTEDIDPMQKDIDALVNVELVDEDEPLT